MSCENCIHSNLIRVFFQIVSHRFLKSISNKDANRDKMEDLIG